MADTSIEWTEKTWNPVVGCSRVSRGCEHCYAERVAHRGMSPQHRGLTVLGKHGPRWTGEVRFLPDRLGEPLRWRKPARVFVNSMSDLFHEGLSFEHIAAIFGVMAACPQHTFQVLTKRPARAHEFFAWAKAYGDGYDLLRIEPSELLACAFEACSGDAWGDIEPPAILEATPSSEVFGTRWPLPNVWLGVSVEDQSTADKRIPILLELPAAVRWVSYEPALGAVNFRPFIGTECTHEDAYTEPDTNATVCRHCDEAAHLDWIVVGGESGPGARPFDLAWARSTIRQCRAAGVPVFCKQVGPRPFETLTSAITGERMEHAYPTRDRKGGDMSEWPEDLRVREMPEVRRG